MIGAFLTAFAQMTDRRFLSVLIRSLALTIFLLALIGGGLIWLTSLVAGDLNFTIPLIGYEVNFADDLALGGVVLLFLAGSVFLMYPVAAIFIGLFLDEIADAVEEKHYPDLPEARRQSLPEILRQSLAFTATLIVANLLALVVYLVATVFAPFVFWLVNGYLLGREYFEVVAMRRLDLKEAKRLRRRNFMTVWIAGALIAAPLSVPILNLFAPLVGVAVFVHLFHRAWRPA